MSEQNLALEFRRRWNERTTTFGTETLARQIDPRVVIKRTYHPYTTDYIFEDNSVARCKGRGRYFHILYAGVEQ